MTTQIQQSASHASTATRAVSRNEYGGLRMASSLSAEELVAVQSLLANAVKADLIPEAYAEQSRREFESLNHHVYDVLTSEGTVIAVVVLALWFWKDLRKLRTRLEKTYFLVQSTSDGSTRVMELDGRTCAKRAKNAPALGQLTRHYLGLEQVKCATPSVKIRRGYKVVARTDDGEWVSAFDGSVYSPQVWRTDTAKEDHGGGFYYYETRHEAVAMTRRGVTFAQCVSEGKSLVLCSVEVAGRVIAYDSGKLAASRLRILEELETVEIDSDA